jgi:hypothetical protein
VGRGQTAGTRGGGAGRAREGKGEGERDMEGEGSSPWDLKSGDNSPPDHLGQGGGREVEERERELLRGKPK